VEYYANPIGGDEGGTCEITTELYTCDGLCEDGRCFPPSCDDGIQNQGEEDIDCGGPCDLPCDICSVGTLPVRFDWRDWKGGNWISPVRAQDNCGSCWAHAALAAVEGRYEIEQNNPDLDINLSEQYLVSDCFDCWCDCGGGSAKKALRFIRDDGVPDEACFPYEHRDTSCRPCGDYEDRLWRVGEYHKISGSNDADAVKRAILCHAPLVTCTSDWEHCVVLIGWDTDNETCRNAYGEDSCWIIKNSHGEFTGWEDTDTDGCESARVYHVDGIAYIPFEGHDYSRPVRLGIRYIGDVQAPS